MELLELTPPEYGISSAGIYVIDDDGLRPVAGPFSSDTAAIAWVVQRQEYLHDTSTSSVLRHALTIQAALA